MRIFEERTYTMYLNEEEFGLLFEITKHIPYSYLYDTEENEYRIVMDEDMLKNAASVKLLCVTATGYDNIDIEFCKSSKIQFASATLFRIASK